jgi:small subunit ribosomal protein S9
MAQEKVTSPVEKKSVASKKAAKKQSSAAPISHGVGRRKNAVARVWLYKGTGKFTINGDEVTTYFDTPATRIAATAIAKVYPSTTSYDIAVNVIGGGKVGQAGAVKLGAARAFLALDESMRPMLRTNNMLTVDARNKERKKYGQRGARRKFQFVKR